MTIEELRTSGRLPSPKGVALSVMRLARRDDVTMEEIAEVVQTDPAITGRLIRLANSALHPGRPVVAVRDAIVRLGLRAVSQITLGFSLVDQYREGPCEAFDYQQFWSRSLLMALAARELGARMHLKAVEELFACGLLANIGSLALATAYPAEYSDVLRKAALREAPLLELERQTLHTDHEECTAALLHEFGLPDTLTEAVVHHRCPASSAVAPGSRAERVLQVLALASRIADLAFVPEISREECVASLLADAAQVSLDTEMLDELTERVFGEWREWSELLRVPVHFAQPFVRVSRPEPANVAHEPEALRVLLIEEEPSSRLLLSGIISRLGHAVYTAVSREEALAMAVEVVPQVVVTDCAQPTDTDLEFCHSLRGTEWGRAVYVIALTRTESISPEHVDMHADDYLPTPVNVPLMRLRLRAASRHIQLLQERERDRARLARLAEELAVSNRRLQEAALTDMLTNLPNRRAGMEFLARAWSAADRYQHSLGVMLVDVDGLQDVNQTYGHAVGDEVVTAVAGVLRESGRRCDHVSRMGGAEFLVVCPNTEIESMRNAAERLCDAVRSLKFRAGEQTVSVTVGIGMASREPGMPDADALIRAADRALRAAKTVGQDRIGVTAGGQASVAGD